MEDNEIFGGESSAQESEKVQINERLEEAKEENTVGGVEVVEDMFDDHNESHAQSQEDTFDISVEPGIRDEDEVNERIICEDAHEDVNACEILEETQDPDESQSHE